MIDSPVYFYQLFLKTRYTDVFTVGDLKKYAELIMLSSLDFKKVRFHKASQEKILGRFLSVTEERIDRVILNSNKFAKMAMSFIEQQLNPYEAKDESKKWPILTTHQKALLLKYLVLLKQDSNNTHLLENILKQNLDTEMIPLRFFKSTTEEIQEYIKTYDPQYVSSLQLSIEV